jgi:hypothetical protein
MIAVPRQVALQPNPILSVSTTNVLLDRHRGGPTCPYIVPRDAEATQRVVLNQVTLHEAPTVGLLELLQLTVGLGLEVFMESAVLRVGGRGGFIHVVRLCQTHQLRGAAASSGRGPTTSRPLGRSARFREGAGQHTRRSPSASFPCTDRPSSHGR